MIGNQRTQSHGSGLRPLPSSATIAPQPRQPTEDVARSEHAGGGLLTPADAAKWLGVNERVLERWRGTGDGPAYAKLTRRTVRYRTEDLEAFVAGSVRRNTAE